MTASINTTLRSVALFAIVLSAMAAQEPAASSPDAPTPASSTSAALGSQAQESATGTATEPPSAQEAAAREAVDAALGAKVFAEQCVRCHDAPDPASRSRRQWNAIALHMRAFADISRQDEERVLAFLRKFNTATMSHEPGVPASR
jgi:hypothetical protein